MTEATFWPAGLGERAARGRVERDGSEHFLAPEWYGSRYALPFTGLWATSEDLVRFGQTLIAAPPDERAPLHAMATPAIDRGHGPGPVVRTRHGHRSLEHDGAGPGFTAWLVAVPDLNLVVALACNADGESGDRARQVAAVTDEILALLLAR